MVGFSRNNCLIQINLLRRGGHEEGWEEVPSFYFEKTKRINRATIKLGIKYIRGLKLPGLLPVEIGAEVNDGVLSVAFIKSRSDI